VSISVSASGPDLEKGQYETKSEIGLYSSDMLIIYDKVIDVIGKLIMMNPYRMVPRSYRFINPINYSYIYHKP